MEIQVRVRRLHAQTASGKACAVCGNSGDTIRFDFDEPWSRYPEKTAHIVSLAPMKELCLDVAFHGNICPLPPIFETTAIYVSVRAGGLRTTTPAEIPYRTCITDLASEEARPQPDFYNRLLAALAHQPVQDICNGNYLVTAAGDYLATANGNYIMTKE